MSAIAYLIVYSLVVLTVAPPLLESLTAGGHTPRLGVTAWLTAIASVLLSWVAVALLALSGLVQLCTRGSGFMVACMDWLHREAMGDDGVAPQIILLAGVIAVGAAGITIFARLATSARRLRTRSRVHADALSVVGRRAGPDGVVVVSADQAAAYCVPGKPPTIVVTSAALAALGDRELAAVLAHERAHLRGHHWIILIALRSLVAALPRLTLIRQAAQAVPRLLEMCADDAAARRHDRRDLLSGLITLCGAAPSEALAAAEIAVLARAERLIGAPTTRARRRTSVALSATITILGSAPWVTTVSACIPNLSCNM